MATPYWYCIEFHRDAVRPFDAWSTYCSVYVHCDATKRSHNQGNRPNVTASIALCLRSIFIPRCVVFLSAFVPIVRPLSSMPWFVLSNHSCLLPEFDSIISGTKQPCWMQNVKHRHLMVQVFAAQHNGLVRVSVQSRLMYISHQCNMS